MKRLFQVLLVLCLCLPVFAQTVTVSATNIQQDASGIKLAQGSIQWLPVDCRTGIPTGFFNGGQGGSGEVVFGIVNGSYSGTLVDALAANTCDRVTVQDSNGNVIIGPKFFGAPPTGYEFVQPTQNSPANNPWCVAGVCNFDNYLPTMSPVQLGQWGHLTGNITNQVDLVAYIATHGGGVQYVFTAPSGSCPSTAQVQVNNGLLYSCQSGTWGQIAGSGGQSAYQLAVSTGYSGTLSQWLASLVGSAGATPSGLPNLALMTNPSGSSSATATLRAIVAADIAAALASGQVSTVAVGTMLPTTYTVATLPTAQLTGTVAMISDANPNCSTGGGTSKTQCRYNGSAWDMLGGSNYTLPSDVVKNDQANTYGAYLQDFSSASEIKVPTPTNASDAASKAYADTKQAALTNPVTGPGSGATVHHMAGCANTSCTLIEDEGTVPTVPSNITTQGNTFNGASQLVQMTSGAKLPAVDGSLLTNLPNSGVTLTGTYSASYPMYYATSATTMAPDLIFNYNYSTGLHTFSQDVAFASTTNPSYSAAFHISYLGANRTYTYPDATGNVVLDSATQTLTNKTVDGVTPTVFGYLDPTSSVQTQLSAKAPSAAPILTNPVEIQGSSLSAGTGSGSSITAASLTLGSAYYFGASGLALAKADTATTLPAVGLSISTTTVVFSGVYKFSASQSWTVGGPIYVSDATAGALTQTAPSTSGHCVQRVGIALAVDTILIMPSLDVGTIQ